MAEPRPVIIKVGGSLGDLPDLGARLERFLNQDSVQPAFLVPGGGALVEAVRRLDREQGLGDEASHWLALRDLSVAAAALARLVPGGSVVADAEEATTVWRQGGVPILDAHRFAERDDADPHALPHSWHTTSDAIAARLAEVCGARRLVLLKSISLPTRIDWVEASRQGWVDEVLPVVLGRCGKLETDVVNLRVWPTEK